MSGGVNAEQRYTLAEAQAEIARRECATTGHLFDVIELVGSGDPHGIVCTRCGRSWAIAQTTTAPDSPD